MPAFDCLCAAHKAILPCLMNIFLFTTFRNGPYFKAAKEHPPANTCNPLAICRCISYFR